MMTEKEIYETINKHRVKLVGLHRDFMLARSLAEAVAVKNEIDLRLSIIGDCKKLLSIKRQLGEI